MLICGFFFVWGNDIIIMQSRLAKQKGGKKMSVRARLLALRLLEKQKKKPELFKQLGIEVTMKEKVKK